MWGNLSKQLLEQEGLEVCLPKPGKNNERCVPLLELCKSIVWFGNSLFTFKLHI